MVEPGVSAMPAIHNPLHGLHQAQEKNGVGRMISKPYIKRLAIIFFGICLQVSYVAVALSFQAALPNGGPASLVYGSVIASAGSSLVSLALAEMASTDPQVGAQYRWSARFAPSAPSFFGFIQGWITVIAWICSCAGAFSFMSNTLSGLIIFNSPDYEPKGWHSTLFLMAFLIVPLVLNLYFKRIVNRLEKVGGILYVVMFIVVIVILSVLSKRSTPEFVFSTLHTDGGWSNLFAAISIGLLPIVYAISGFDGVLHMTNETIDDKIRVPQAMVTATAVNSVLMVAFCICLMFTIGDEEAVAESILPITAVFESATGSKTVSTVLTTLLGFQLMIGNFNIVASVARLVHCFALDRGLPFHQYFTKVHPTLGVPIPALGLIGVACCLLSLINIGSTTAFNSLISLPTIALYTSYFVPIFLLTIHQLAGKDWKPGPFHLGIYSVPVKILAMVYLLYIIIFVSFPASMPLTISNMNYAPFIFIGLLLFAMIDWFARGRKTFELQDKR